MNLNPERESGRPGRHLAEPAHSASGAPHGEVLPSFLRVAQVAALTRLPASTVYHFAAAGRLPAVRIGKRVLVPESAIWSLAEAAHANDSGKQGFPPLEGPEIARVRNGHMKSTSDRTPSQQHLQSPRGANGTGSVGPKNDPDARVHWFDRFERVAGSEDPSTKRYKRVRTYARARGRAGYDEAIAMQLTWQQAKNSPYEGAGPELIGFCEWFIVLKEEKNKYEASTSAAYRSFIRAHLEPEFGPKRYLSSITPRDIQFFESKLVRRLASKTVADKLNWLLEVFDRAVALELVSRNPVAAIERIRVVETKRATDRKRPLEDIVAFVMATEEHPDQVELLTPLVLSARHQSFLAIANRDFDRKRGGIRLTDFKTKTLRVLQAPDPYRQMLLSHVARMEESGPLEPDSLLFTGPGGAALSASESLARLRNFQKDHDLVVTDMHTLKHSIRTVLASIGATDKQASQWMGNAEGGSGPSSFSKYGKSQDYRRSELIPSALMMETARLLGQLFLGPLLKPGEYEMPAELADVIETLRQERLQSPRTATTGTAAQRSRALRGP